MLEPMHAEKPTFPNVAPQVQIDYENAHHLDGELICCFGSSTNKFLQPPYFDGLEFHFN